MTKTRALLQRHRAPLAKSCCFSAPLPALKSLGTSTRYLGITAAAAWRVPLADPKSYALPKGRRGRGCERGPHPGREPDLHPPPLSGGAAGPEQLDRLSHESPGRDASRASRGSQAAPAKPAGMPAERFTAPYAQSPQDANPNSFCFNCPSRETLRYHLSQFSKGSL